MTREEIKKLVDSDPGYAVGALLALYSFQTDDEQMMHGTMYQNGAGFNGADGPFFTSLVDFYRERGHLTPNMLNAVRKGLPKYFGQLAGYPLERCSFNAPAIKLTRKLPPGFNAMPELPVKTVTIKNDTFIISFPYNMLTVAQVKTLSGRSWDAETKNWSAPVCYDSYKKLREWEFAFIKCDEEIAKLKAETEGEIVEGPLFDMIPGLKRTLFPYQLEGVQFIERKKGRALIADEMGLGKTGQALAYLQLHPEIRPAVIVVPATLKLNWEKEIDLWMSSKCRSQVIDGRPSENNTLKNAHIYIINYDILANQYLSIENARGDFSWVHTKRHVKIKKLETQYEQIPYSGWADHLADLKPQILITDECHKYKNSDAARTVAVLALAKQIPYFIELSGTPIENRPIEMYNAIHALNPKLFPSYFAYARRYCGATHDGWGWDFNGASNMEELHKLLTETIMIRRLKKDVLKDLPPKTRSLVPMELNNVREYRRAENEFIAWVKEKYGSKKAEAASSAEALVRIGELKRLAVKGKLDACIDWINDFIETGEKLVVFAVHSFVIDAIMKKFKKVAVKIDGSVGNADRQKAVDAFQENDKIRLFVGNIQAAGVGITLTAASNTCFLELPWHGPALTQAEDRVHRIGQEASCVTAWYLLADKTIEIEILELIQEKQKILDMVIDGADEESAGDSVFKEFLNRYKK